MSRAMRYSIAMYEDSDGLWIASISRWRGGAGTRPGGPTAKYRVVMQAPIAGTTQQELRQALERILERI